MTTGSSSQGAHWDDEIAIGAEYRLDTTLLNEDETPIDVSDWEARGAIRPEETTDDSKDLDVEFTFEFGDDDGAFAIIIPSEQTATLAPRREAWYFIDTKAPGGDWQRELEGRMEISP
jgi:hypothetical protein